MKTFKEHYEHYLHGLSSNKFGILVTKYCGYDFFIVIHKHSTLFELYRHIELETGDNKFTLHVDHIELPKSNDLLSNYMLRLRNEKLIEPVYKMPDPVVYRIMIDDGHKH
jgi:hypothetical protein